MRIAINGYGRIGRCVLRALYERDDCQQLIPVAINELAPLRDVCYLTQYDSTHGRFPGEVTTSTSATSPSQDYLKLSNANRSDEIAVYAAVEPEQISWRDRNIDLLLECSGYVKALGHANSYLASGVKRLLLSNPGEPPIPAIVYGVNQQYIDASRDAVLSAASCTSNAIAPVLQVIHQAFGIRSGVITTIHASMHDQPVIDAYHSPDLRKNRAASQSIIPVDTALAQGVGRVLPDLADKFVAQALRVPVNNVSAINLSINTSSQVSAQQVNQNIAQRAASDLAGVLGYTEELLASCDFNHDPRSGVVDANQTAVIQDELGSTINLLIWFDNEWAFANRMLDLALLIANGNTAE